jgi:ribosomal protein S18 acetylase RimI-like enzyme
VDNINIRKLKAEDSDAIADISEDITQTPVDSNFKRMVAEQAEKSQNASFVADIEGKVVGYLISYMLPGSFGTDKSAWVAMLGVSPIFMGQGIGESLATETFGFYKKEGIKNIYTSVIWDSTDLLSFFKRLGFDRSNFINLCKKID